MLPGDTVEALHERIKAVEHRLYPQTIEQFSAMRALLSVYDKTGVVDLAARPDRRWGGSWCPAAALPSALADAGVAVTEVSRGHRLARDARRPGQDPPSPDPRRHPRRPRDPDHVADLGAHGIEPIDLVVSNLYPFAAEPSIEMIDIGGPTMVRAAAKNHAHVGVVVDPADYADVLDELRERRAGCGHAPPAGPQGVRPHRGLRRGHRRRGSTARRRRRAPAHVAPQPWSGRRTCATARTPTRSAPATGASEHTSWWDEPSSTAARSCPTSTSTTPRRRGGWCTIWATDAAAAVIIKHANPCGVAVAEDITTAYVRAHECDPRLGVRRHRRRQPADAGERSRRRWHRCSPRSSSRPAYEPAALEVLAAKQEPPRAGGASRPDSEPLDLRSIDGGLLVQEVDRSAPDRSTWRVVTKVAPTDAPVARPRARLARVRPTSRRTPSCSWPTAGPVGIGAGQQNRVDAGPHRGREGRGPGQGRRRARATPSSPSATASTPRVAAGVAAVIEPGGSMRDAEVIAAADEHGIALVFTGERHFRHTEAVTNWRVQPFHHRPRRRPRRDRDPSTARRCSPR